MKGIFFLTTFFLLLGYFSNAQQRLEPRAMNYVNNAKPKSIIYHDTLYSGSKQFEQLFYRTADMELIRLVKKHQSNKITGQILGFAGTIATIIGINRVTSGSTEKGLGWALIGGGFAATLTGGYLTLMGQKNLIMAITLFNQRYHQAALGIGVSQNTAGLVYKF
jgi:hypothetical protein